MSFHAHRAAPSLDKRGYEERGAPPNLNPPASPIPAPEDLRACLGEVGDETASASLSSPVSSEPSSPARASRIMCTVVSNDLRRFEGELVLVVPKELFLLWPRRWRAGGGPPPGELTGSGLLEGM